MNSRPARLGGAWKYPALRASLASVFAFALFAASAGAAQPPKPEFADGLGSALPTIGSVSQVSVSCPESGQGLCRGTVTLIPRGKTEAELGTKAIGAESFKLKPGGDADLRLRLAPAAVKGLAAGPLLVTAVLRSGDATKPVSERQVAIDHATSYNPSALALDARRARIATASEATTYSWDYKIPAGSALVLKEFKCPASAPRVAAGADHPIAGKFNNRPHTFHQYDGKIEVKASDGTGYAGFDRAITDAVPGRKEFGFQLPNWTFMLGWQKGDLFHNSIWAPVFVAGTFSLKVTCSDGGERGTARLLELYDPPGATNLFPWKW